MLEDGSSSPSDNLRVVSFERAGAGSVAAGASGLPRAGGTIEERWRLQLSDGSSFFVPEECLREAGLSLQGLAAGAELGPGTAEALRRCSRAFEARCKAVELLARRAHSVEELRRKLLQRRFDGSHIDKALLWLDERGYLDDGEFAREWARRRLARHPEGRLALFAGLSRRGIPRELAEEVLDELCTAEGENQAARAALDGLLRRSGGQAPGEDKLRRALQRRGFRSSLIVELLRERRVGGGYSEGSG